MTNPTVTLSPRQIARADEVARWRTDDACGRGNGISHPFNVADTYEETLENSTRGCRCEVAGWKFFKGVLVWHAYEPKTTNGGFGHLPDLGDRIDVKGVAEDWHKLVVRPEHLKPERVYLLICAKQHPTYEIIGWMKGEEVATFPIKALRAGTNPSHVVLPKKLHDPWILYHEVMRRAGYETDRDGHVQGAARP